MKYIAYLILPSLLLSGNVYADQQPQKKAKVHATAKANNLVAKEKGSISGQVFIVTRGGENIKLALVEVSAISENEMLQHIKSLQSYKLDLKNSIQSENQKLQTAYEEVKMSEQAASAARSREFRIRSETDDRGGCRTVNDRVHCASEKDPGSVQAAADWKAAIAQLEIKNAALLALREFSQGYASMWERLASGEQYFIPKPSGVGEEKTDADGKFYFDLPTGKYALMAKSTRHVFDQTESYYWLVWVNVSSKNKSIMLSNDNMFSTQCKDCVLAD